MPIYDTDGTVAYAIGKLYDTDGTVAYQTKEVYDHDGTVARMIYNSEEVYIPNMEEYPQEAYSIYSNGGSYTLDVAPDGTGMITTATGNGLYQLAYLPINCAGYDTLTWSGDCTPYNTDGNYRKVMGFISSTALLEDIVSHGVELDVYHIVNGWSDPSESSGTFSVAGYNMIYAVFGQGTTIANGDFGHGFCRFSSIILR